MENIQKELFEDDLKNTTWIGEVVNNEDPNFDNRIKVRIKGKFDLFTDDDLPWAICENQISSGSISGSGTYDVPKIGSIVGIRFENGNIYQPCYFKIQHVSNELKNEIISVSDTPYTVKSIWYDSDIKLKGYFNEADGINISYKDSQFNIRDDNTIWLQHNNGLGIHIQNEMISLGSENTSSEPAVLGDKNVDALTELYNRIKDLTEALQKFAMTQSLVTGSVSYLAPLNGAWSSLLTTSLSILAQLPALPNSTIPATLSEKVTLD